MIVSHNCEMTRYVIIMGCYQIVPGKVGFTENTAHISKTQIQVSKCSVGAKC